MKLSRQRFDHVGTIANGEDRGAGMFPGSPQEIIDSDICITVVAIFHIRAFAKKSIRFVEKQNDATIFRGVKDSTEILFCLANVIGGYDFQVDPV